MRVRWTGPAARDLTQICDYIQEYNSRTTARRVAISIYDRVGALAEFPEQGRPGRKEGCATRRDFSWCQSVTLDQSQYLVA
jgi:plasmid stabilization system protein ParE